MQKEIKLKLLYIHQYFITPKEAGGARSYYVAKKLVENGVKVTVITSNTKYKDWDFVETKNIDGIEVKYIKNYYDSSMGKFMRIFSFFKFMLYSTIFALKEKNVDILFASSTPLTIGLPALIKNFFNKNIKFVFEVRDVWPAIPYEMGYIKNKMVFQLLKLFERKLYDSSDKIITISEGIKQKIDVEFHHKIKVFPFGSNLNLFNLDKKNTWKLKNNINQEMLYVFTGAVGLVNGLEYLIETAKILQKKCDNIHIAVVGNGSAKESMIQVSKDYRLTNISFFEPVPIEELNKIYESADAGIILFGKESESYRFTASPNKFFDYIAAGLPFFFNFGGPLKDLIENKNVGIYTNYLTPEDLAEKMMYYAKNKKQLYEIGQNGRKLAENEFEREQILENMIKEILNA